jgi:hypothetical protein
MAQFRPRALEFAKSLVGSRHDPLEFSGPAALSRAFKRWTGSSPRTMRAAKIENDQTRSDLDDLVHAHDSGTFLPPHTHVAHLVFVLSGEFTESRVVSRGDAHPRQCLFAGPIAEAMERAKVSAAIVSALLEFSAAP